MTVVSTRTMTNNIAKHNNNENDDASTRTMTNDDAKHKNNANEAAMHKNNNK